MRMKIWALVFSSIAVTLHVVCFVNEPLSGLVAVPYAQEIEYRSDGWVKDRIHSGSTPKTGDRYRLRNIPLQPSFHAA
jgi:hypothetical protein